MNNEPKLPTPKLSSEEISELLASKNMADWTDTVGKIMGLRKEVIPPDWEDVVVKGEMWKKLPWCNLKANLSTTKAQEAEVNEWIGVTNPTTTAASVAPNQWSCEEIEELKRLTAGPSKRAQVRPEATPHYAKHPSGIECITIAEGFNFNLGNVIKYVWRAGLKGGAIDDLKKARDYINFEIERIERSK